MTTHKIRILLVDDHAIVRTGFKMLLATQEAIEVIAEASRGETALQQYQTLKPDLVIMDLSMPGIGGLETIKRLCQKDSEALILVFSVHHEQVYINRALSAGAKAYITKNSAPELLLDAINAVMLGEIYVEKNLLTTTPLSDTIDYYQTIIAGFSAREFDVFKRLALGMSVFNIAEELCLNYKTVANYGTQIRKKLQTNSLIEIARIADDFDKPR